MPKCARDLVLLKMAEDEVLQLSRWYYKNSCENHMDDKYHCYVIFSSLGKLGRLFNGISPAMRREYSMIPWNVVRRFANIVLDPASSKMFKTMRQFINEDLATLKKNIRFLIDAEDLLDLPEKDVELHVTRKRKRRQKDDRVLTPVVHEKQTLIDILHTNRAALQTFALKHLYLTGSFARDREIHPYSDIDFMVD